jgi:acyl carrier protein
MDAESRGTGELAALAEVLRRHLPTESATAPVERDVNLSALGLGSIELAMFVVDLEQTFGLEFPEHMLVPETFRTAGTVAAAIAALAGQKGD